MQYFGLVRNIAVKGLSALMKLHILSLIISLQSHHERERSLEETVRELQNQIETEQVEYRRLEWSNKDTLKERELQEQR